MYQDLLNEYKSLIKETRNLLTSYPENKRDQILFGEWNLKDVIAHLNHWAQHDLNCFEPFKRDKIPYWVPDVDEYNAEGVRIRKGKSFEDLILEFDDLLSKVLTEFDSLQDNDWNKKFWPDRKFTPKVFMDIDIDHYKNEHIPELKAKL